MVDMVVFGLIRRRSEMAGEVEMLRDKLSATLAGLEHLDATIRLFKPDLEPDMIPDRMQPPPQAAFRGEIQRFILHTLRTAGSPMTTIQIAHAILASRNLTTDDRIITKLVERRTGCSLGRLRRKGFVVGGRYDNTGVIRWRLVPQT